MKHYRCDKCGARVDEERIALFELESLPTCSNCNGTKFTTMTFHITESKIVEKPRMRSVLQDWVMELPLRHQGSLIVALRGCDLAPKLPLDSLERTLTACIRGAVLVAADPREIDSAQGCFMQTRLPVYFKISAIEHYPAHWLLHVMHAAEVLAYCHPDDNIKLHWKAVYIRFVQALHLNLETEKEFQSRMTEDRIANNTVVS